MTTKNIVNIQNNKLDFYVNGTNKFNVTLRGKNILEVIEKNKNKNHFCVFDELYSGTNPEEAIESAYGYLKHLNNNENIDYILTTHYYKLCKKLVKENKNKVQNCHMEIKYKNNKQDYEFTYKLKPGTSKIKGGIKVLKDLEYPDEILENFK